MGREIVYCFKCQRRILGDELDKGSAYQVGNQFTCSTCAVHLLETLPPREKEKLLAKMFQETKDRQSGPSHGPKGATPTPRRGTSTSEIKVVKVPVPVPVRPSTRAGPRWGILAGVGLGILLTISAVVMLGSSPSAEPPAPPSKTPGPSREEQRRQAAADAIRKARNAAQAGGSDVDRVVTLWQEAVFAADGTPYIADARKEHEAAQARQREAIRKELGELDERVRPLVDKEEFKAAQETVEAARLRHASTDWVVEVSRKADAIRNQLAKALPALQEQAAGARRSGDEAAAAKLRARIAGWGVPQSLADFDKALAAVALPRPLADPALVGYWPLDEGTGIVARDASGKGNTATLTSTTWVPGKFGSGVRFDGVQSLVEISRSPELDVLQNRDYTLCAWFKPEAVPDSGAESYAVVGKRGFHAGLYFSLQSRFYMGHWFQEKSPVYIQVDSGRSYPPGAFHHVVGVVDWTGGATRLYVDGILDGTIKWSRPKLPCMDHGSNPWRIGMILPEAKEYRCAAKAVINEVRLYSRPLTEAEVQVLFRARPAPR